MLVVVPGLLPETIVDDYYSVLGKCFPHVLQAMQQHLAQLLLSDDLPGKPLWTFQGPHIRVTLLAAPVAKTSTNKSNVVLFYCFNLGSLLGTIYNKIVFRLTDKQQSYRVHSVRIGPPFFWSCDSFACSTLTIRVPHSVLLVRGERFSQQQMWRS